MAQSNIGQILAFLIGLAALGASTYCIVNGFEWSGSAIGLGGLTGLVTAFIKGRDHQEKNLENKRPQMRGQTCIRAAKRRTQPQPGPAPNLPRFCTLAKSSHHSQQRVHMPHPHPRGGFNVAASSDIRAVNSNCDACMSSWLLLDSKVNCASHRRSKTRRHMFQALTRRERPGQPSATAKPHERAALPVACLPAQHGARCTRLPPSESFLIHKASRQVQRHPLCGYSVRHFSPGLGRHRRANALYMYLRANLVLQQWRSQNTLVLYFDDMSD